MSPTPEELYPLVGVGFILPEVPGYIEYPVTQEPGSETRGVHDAHFREFVNT